MDAKAEQQIRDAVVARYEFSEDFPDNLTIAAIVEATLEEIDRLPTAPGAELMFTPDGLTAQGLTLLRKCVNGSGDPEDTRIANATLDALVRSLSYRKPFSGYMIRVERGDFVRASGDAFCNVCEIKIYDHPSVPGYGWLRMRCDGTLIKI